jgi:hypothetical protein
MDYSNPANLLIAGIYYVIATLIAFFSIFSVYILLRYGQNRALSLVVSVLYSLFFILLLQQSYSTLQSIK